VPGEASVASSQDLRSLRRPVFSPGLCEASIWLGLGDWSAMTPGGVPDLPRPDRVHVAPFGDSLHSCSSSGSIPLRSDRMCQDNLKGSVGVKPARDLTLDLRQGSGCQPQERPQNTRCQRVTHSLAILVTH
jgi:hypothetical protein